MYVKRVGPANVSSASSFKKHLVGGWFYFERLISRYSEQASSRRQTPSGKYQQFPARNSKSDSPKYPHLTAMKFPETVD